MLGCFGHHSCIERERVCVDLGSKKKETLTTLSKHYLGIQTRKRITTTVVL
jgi:hypothetical protein